MTRVLFVLLMLLCSTCTFTESSEQTEAAVIADEPFYAPDFTLTGLDNSMYSLSALRGQWVLVNFWATWCGPCIEELPVLQRLSHMYSGELTVLAINMREDLAQVQAFASQHELTIPILLNPPDEVVLAYTVLGLPQTLMVDPAGEIVLRSFGPLELDSLENTLLGLMNG